MKINVEKWIVHDKKDKVYDIISYKLVDITYCCEKIKTFPLLDLHYEWRQNFDDMELLSDEFDQVLGVMLEESYTEYDGEDMQTDQRYHLITHCPRCGEVIEINVVKEVDKTDEYYKLKEEYIKVHGEWRDCDSIKLKSELDRQWRSIDCKMNSYYKTDGFKENK